MARFVSADGELKKKKSSKNNLLEAYSILRSIQDSRSFQQNEVW